MSKSNLFRWLLPCAALLLIAALGGCGNKGDLVRPGTPPATQN